MNVTEAVDSLSAMFQPSEQLTQSRFPVTHLHITFLHLFASFLATELPGALSATWLQFWRKTVKVLRFSNPLQNWNLHNELKCLLWFFSSFLEALFFTLTSNLRNSWFSPPHLRNKVHFTYSPEIYMFTYTCVDFDSSIRVSNPLSCGDRKTLSVCQKLPFEVLTEFSGLCAEEEFRILKDYYYSPAYLTASYLNCAKCIGFTV